MDPLQFCYWLKGVFELSKIECFDEQQTKLIKEHLDLVFTKQTSPDISNIKIDFDCLKENQPLAFDPNTTPALDSPFYWGGHKKYC